MPIESHKRLILLASTSPYRKTLLERLGVPFETRAPQVDETPLHEEDASHMVNRLALAKAQAVLTQNPSALVIGSDQMAECGNQIIGKPGNAAKARAQLRGFRGQTVRFLSAVAVMDGATGGEFRRTVVTQVHFRHYTDDEIDRYLALDQPFDCAGSFKSERAGIALLSRMSSDDPTALIGLPLITVAEALRSFDIAVP